MAWLSPVAVSTQRYRVAQLWFEAEGSFQTKPRVEVGNQASQRGTVQHEVFEDGRAILITEDTNLTIKVNCREEAARIQEPIAYGLAVTLEVAEGVNIAIYDEVRARIAPPVEIPTAAHSSQV